LEKDVQQPAQENETTRREEVTFSSPEPKADLLGLRGRHRRVSSLVRRLDFGLRRGANGHWLGFDRVGAGSLDAPSRFCPAGTLPGLTGEQMFV
jgi:hypothetical protein